MHSRSRDAPTAVGTSVISATQNWFGGAEAKLRAARSGAGRTSRSRSVVMGPPRRWLAPTRQASRISRAMGARACGNAGRPARAGRRGCAARHRSRASREGRRGSGSAGRRPPRVAPRVRAITVIGKSAWSALMNRKTPRAELRSPTQTRPQRPNRGNPNPTHRQRASRRGSGTLPHAGQGPSLDRLSQAKRPPRTSGPFSSVQTRTAAWEPTFKLKPNDSSDH